MISSQSVRVWPYTDSIAGRRNRNRLQAGTITDTRAAEARPLSRLMLAPALGYASRAVRVPFHQIPAALEHRAAGWGALRTPKAAQTQETFLAGCPMRTSSIKSYAPFSAQRIVVLPRAAVHIDTSRIPPGFR